MSEKRKRYKEPDQSDLNQEVIREHFERQPEGVDGEIEKEATGGEIGKMIAEIDELTDKSESPDISEEIKRSAFKITEESGYSDLVSRYDKGEISKELLKKFQDYKNKFQEILNSNNQMEKNPTTKPEDVKTAPEDSEQKQKSGPRIGKLERELKEKEDTLKIFEKVATPEQKAADLERRKKEITDLKEKINKKISEGKKSAKKDVESATTVVIDKKEAEEADKAAAEASQKTAEEKIDAAGTVAEKTAAELFEEAQAMEAGEKVKAEAVIEAVEIEKAKEPEIKKEITEEEKREIQDYIYGDKDRHLELYKLWAGKSDEKEFSNGYRIPQEAEKAAFDFFQRREEYSKYFKDESAALRQYKKSGYEKGSAELETAKVWKNNAEKALELAQEELKRKLVDDAFAKKVSEYEERGVVRSDKDKKEEYAMITGSMLPRIVELDSELERMKMNTAYETKERGIFGKVWDKYKGLPKGKRLLASAAMSAGIGAGIAAFSPLSLVAGAGYIGYKAARTLGGGALGAGLNAAVDKLFIQKKYGAERQEALSQQSEELRKALLKEMESGDWKKEEKKMKLMEMLDNSALSLGGKYNDIAQREGKARMWAALGTGLVGGLTASGIDVYIMKPSGIGAVALEHKAGAGGVDGPHGAMESMPVGGKSEGMPLGSLAGEPTLGEVGKAFATGDMKLGTIEVHKGDTIWGLIDKKLEGQYETAYEQLGEARKTFAIDALKDKLAAMSPEQLKEIGISSGDINKLNIGDKIDFGKLMTDENMAKALEGAKGLSQEQLASIHENLKGVGGAEAEGMRDLPLQTAEGLKIGGLPGEPSLEQLGRSDFNVNEAAAKWAEQQGAIDQFQTIEKMKEFYDLPAVKLTEVADHFNSIDKKGFWESVYQMRNGFKDFLEIKASDLFPSGDPSQPGATNVYFNKFAYELQRMTNDAAILHDGKTTVRQVLESISSKDIMGGTTEELYEKGVLKP